jgi:hypothetical protein
MKYIPIVAGVLLGLLFVMGGVVVLFHLVKIPALPPSPAATFMDLFFSSGYMTFVKVFEVIGGVLIAIPKTRNYGLLVLGPIIINILAFDVFIAKTVPDPMTIVICLVTLYLLWCGRQKFAALLN